MLFCPRCGSILRPKQEGSKKVLACSCGYASSDLSTSKITESRKKKEEAEIEVVHKDIETLPKINEECPKCRHPEAYYWLLQTRAGDEPETKFLKCVKCKHVWRDYK